MPSTTSCFLAPSPVASSVFHLSPQTLQVACSRRANRQRVCRRQRANINMGLFGLGLPELAVIAGVGIFIFGPSKIAEMGKDLGGLAGGVKKATSEFRDAMEESLAEADKDIEDRKMKKEAASNQTVDASVKEPDTNSS